MTGTWEPIPAAPDPRGLRAGGAVRLDDGRIVVTFWNFALANWGDCLAVYSPGAQTWEVPEVTGIEDRDGCLGSGSVLHPDGRIFGLVNVLDPRSEPWQLTAAPWRDTDHELPDFIGSTGDGRMYGSLNYPDNPRLYELVVETGAIEQVSAYDGIDALDNIVTGVADQLFIGTVDYDTRMSQLASYDPDADAWRTERPAPFQASWARAAHGPEGWIYVPATFQRVMDGGLWARDPANGEWFRVELPDDVPADWQPVLVDGGDGRLYAFDPLHPYVFTPGGVREVPIP